MICSPANFSGTENIITSSLRACDRHGSYLNDRRSKLLVFCIQRQRVRHTNWTIFYCIIPLCFSWIKKIESFQKRCNRSFTFLSFRWTFRLVSSLYFVVASSIDRCSRIYCTTKILKVSEHCESPHYGRFTNCELTSLQWTRSVYQSQRECSTIWRSKSLS